MDSVLSRRTFLKSIANAGIGLSLVSGGGAAAPTVNPTVVPRRPFGSTGETISQLALGCAFDTDNNHLLLRKALDAGVTYWDTGTSYGYGGSEAGIGRFFKRYPDLRAKVFLCTKTRLALPQGMTWALEKSLERLQTTYVDLYSAHAVSGMDEFDAGVREWVRQAKRQGAIRFFGITTHKNMQQCMMAAARLGWIDAVMMSYNYRLMHRKSMREAVAACRKAGVALIAMKSQAAASDSLVGRGQAKDNLVLESFLERDDTPHQARLKAVWQNRAISSICSHMPNMSILNANVAAAANWASYQPDADRGWAHHDRLTRSTYCAGCGVHCEPHVTGNVPIADVMRHLMYANAYGDERRARRYVQRLSPDMRRVMRTADFSEAERRCPRSMAIERLMKQAIVSFG